MELSVEVEKPSSILRKLKIKVPAQEVKNHLQKGLAEVQRTAKIHGFRPGMAPISIVKKYYGEDIKDRVLKALVGEALGSAIDQQEIRTVGSPQVEAAGLEAHAHVDGEPCGHDHRLALPADEDKDFSFVATVEVLPELHLVDYKGVTLTSEKIDATDEDVEKVVENLLNSRAQLVPVVAAEGAELRAVQMGDFVDVNLTGGVVTESGVQLDPGLEGNRHFEVRQDGWIPGFEENFVGMRVGETKTFRVPFPAEFPAPHAAGKEGEFTATLNEFKEKKLPTLNDEFAKEAGFASVDDLRTQAKTFLLKEKTEAQSRRLRSEVLAQIIEKNPFEVPPSLIEGQARALAQDWVAEMKRQRYDDKVIQNAISQELGEIQKRAESQVRASLVLESVAKAEGISVASDDLEGELNRIAAESQVDRPKLDAFYAKNPDRKADLEFKLRQERTLAFLIEKAQIKVA